MLSFETKTLFYRPLDLSDRQLFIDLYSDPTIMKHIVPAFSTEKAGKFFAKILQTNSSNQYSLSIQLKNSEQKIGIVGISKLSEQKVNLGILLKREFHRKGYPLEVLAGFIKNHQNLSPNTIFCTEIHNKNFPAKALMKQLGFTEKKVEAERSFWELALND